MGFISFSMTYYQENLKDFESNPVTDERLYKARQLLKMLEDLQDEGYFYLCNQLEEEFSGITRLRRYLADNHVTPFEITPRIADANELTYPDERFDLETMLKSIGKEVQL